MKKANSYKKEIQIEIGKESNIDTLMKIADSLEGEELGIFSFQDSTRKGVSFGRKLSSFEREGNGLPEPENGLPQQEIHFEFDVRFTLNELEDIELLISQKDMPTHFKFMLKGLSSKQAQMALIDFEQQISNVIKDAIYFHAWACYRKQDENIETRNESYEKIMSNLEAHFKNLLKRKHYKVKKETKENGIKIVTSERVERGRNLKTKAELENQKLEFLEELFNGFKEFRRNHRYLSPKQKDLRPYIYKKISDKEKKISEMLKEHKLKFPELWQTFLANSDKKDFLNAAT